MEHYLTKIKIDKVMHLKDITINLGENQRKHLILTGRNGAGKTSVLNALEGYVEALNHSRIQLYNTFLDEKDGKIRTSHGVVNNFYKGVRVQWNNIDRIEQHFREGAFITAFFPANRLTGVGVVNGVENIILKTAYNANDNPAYNLLKYMVHLKTQQSYAQNEQDEVISDSIGRWFSRFESALKELLDDESIRVQYDYRRYNFLILQDGKEPYDFNSLSDGYSSVIRIVSDLIMRMDQNWLLSGTLSEYDKEGIVLIDELETHLHIELQRKILPFLTTFFPRIQFIVTTHSPYVITSVENAVVFDLERQVEITDPTMYSPEEVAEGYFEAENYSVIIENMMNRYQELCEKLDLTDEERAERAELRIQLKKTKGSLATEVENAVEDMEGVAHGSV